MKSGLYRSNSHQSGSSKRNSLNEEGNMRRFGCMYVFVYVCVCMCVCVYVCVCMCACMVVHVSGSVVCDVFVYLIMCVLYNLLLYRSEY